MDQVDQGFRNSISADSFHGEYFYHKTRVSRNSFVEIYMMENKTNQKKEKKRWSGNMSGDAVYGLGLIGALIYYLQHATTFSIGLLGVLKAFVWPAMVVYEVLKYFKM